MTRGELETVIWQALRRYGATVYRAVPFVDALLDAADAYATTEGRTVILPVREATPLDDPALRYTGVPVSRPRGWGDQ